MIKLGFFNAIFAGVQQMIGVDDTVFRKELQAQQEKTQYLTQADRECDYLLDIKQVTQKAPKCVLNPVSPMDLKVQVFGFYKCVDFRMPSLFVSIVNQGKYIFTPTDKRTNYLKFGEFFQKVEFSQVNLTGISLAKTHGLTDIAPNEAVMLVLHGEFTTFNPNSISLALNYNRVVPEDESGSFKNSIAWVCQNHPVIT